MEAQPSDGCVPIWFGSLQLKRVLCRALAVTFHDFLMKSDHRMHMNINTLVLKRQSVSCCRWQRSGWNVLTDQKAHWIPPVLLNPGHLYTFCRAHFSGPLQIYIIRPNWLFNKPIMRLREVNWVWSSRTRIRKCHLSCCYGLGTVFKVGNLRRKVTSVFTCGKFHMWLTPLRLPYCCWVEMFETGFLQ